MKLDFLPERVKRSLEFLQIEYLQELRLRVGKPSVIKYCGKKWLGECGISQDECDVIIADAKELADIVYKACECSVYAHNDQLRSGFVTTGGIRIGICGRVVTQGEQITTLKEFSSLNIRFPHQVKDCSLKVVSYLIDDASICSTLVISPPGGGKTTFLRDLARILSVRNIASNVLILDERDEFGCMQQGKCQLDVGNADIYSGVSKEWGLINGIRALAPEVIVLDEIITRGDVTAIKYAIGSGVKVMASAHSTDWEELSSKPILKEVLDSKIFDRIVVLSQRNGVGTIESVLDGKGKAIWEA